MKYKVGDRVRIKSLDWYNENKNKDGFVDFSTSVFVPGMSQFCGKIVTIEDVFEEEDDVVYCMEGIDYDWTDEMIEGLVEEESATYSKVIDNGMSNPIIAKTSSATIDTDKCFYSYSDSDGNLEMEWNLPQGYQFVDENGNVINATKIVLEKKKKEYPKTFDKCCHIVQTAFVCDVRLHKGKYYDIFRALAKLIVCRDAYWKIAGEEMGLGKPWEPDYDSLKTKYTIVVVENKVVKLHTLSQNHILTFPIEAMRDVFYENFKELIEQCKELL